MSSRNFDLRLVSIRFCYCSFAPGTPPPHGVRASRQDQRAAIAEAFAQSSPRHGVAATVCSAFAHVSGSAAEQEVVARRREEINHLGVFAEPCLVLRTSRNDHNLTLAADPLFAAEATAGKPACPPGFLAKSITCSGQIIAIDQSLPNSSRTTGYRLRFPAVASQGESIRSQLAVFLHDKHSRTADPLGKAREMPEPDSLGG